MRFLLRKLAHSLLLIIGVTLVSFLLMVYFGPDQTYNLLGKSSSAAQIAEIHQQLGYDRPFMSRYGEYLTGLFSLQLGSSFSNGEPVKSILARTLPVTLMLVLPGFLIGNVLGVMLALLAAWHRGRWPDRLITSASVAGMSISFLIVIILLQVLLCTPFGFNLFPARGWQVSNVPTYLSYATVPSLSLIFITLGYNTRFYRAVFVEESGKEHIRTARAYGASPLAIMGRQVLKNSLVPVTTRILFSIPLIVISGSLLLETYFGIPGIGKVTFDAITNGDQPVLKAVVGLTAALFVVVQFLADLCYRAVDPRIA